MNKLYRQTTAELKRCVRYDYHTLCNHYYMYMPLEFAREKFYVYTLGRILALHCSIQ